MLRVQRYVNEIDNIINKTKVYARELGLVGKYLKTNITNNIRNYLDMLCEKKELTREELTIIINEFREYLNVGLLDEYCLDEEDYLVNDIYKEINDKEYCNEPAEEEDNLILSNTDEGTLN